MYGTRRQSAGQARRHLARVWLTQPLQRGPHRLLRRVGHPDIPQSPHRKVEVLGVKSVTIHPTPEADAHGWSEAFGPTPQLIPVEMVATAIGTDGRGERI
jgi:hypothetical protein